MCRMQQQQLWCYFFDAFIYNVEHVKQPRKYTKGCYIVLEVGQALIQTFNWRKLLFEDLIQR